jgi:uncharacterized protein YjeT (DUF2065 family)
VVRKGTVLAVEAFEGTDEMLRRAGSFKAGGALFVKTVKARQDYRFDVPCFGQRTLETMREAGISAAALEAGGVILLDKARRSWRRPATGASASSASELRAPGRLALGRGSWTHRTSISCGRLTANSPFPCKRTSSP